MGHSGISLGFNQFILAVLAVFFGALLIAYSIKLLIAALRRGSAFKIPPLKRIDRMSGIEFERLLCKLLEAQGYSASLTKGSHDFGADVLAQRKGQIIVVQAKRSARNVGVQAVQQAAASREYYSATEAWIITNSYFTTPAKELAQANSIKLIDRDYFSKRA